MKIRNYRDDFLSFEPKILRIFEDFQPFDVLIKNSWYDLDYLVSKNFKVLYTKENVV